MPDGIPAGKLESRVKIMKKTKVRNSTGEMVDSWVEFGKAWGDVIQISGMDAIKADAITSVVKSSIRIRYKSGVVAGMRAVLRNETYDIRAVLSDQVRVRMDLVCELVK